MMHLVSITKTLSGRSHFALDTEAYLTILLFVSELTAFLKALDI